MTEEEIRKTLAEGNAVCYGIWLWTDKRMRCDDGCCNEIFNSIDEVVESIKECSHGNLSEVEEN